MLPQNINKLFQTNNVVILIPQQQWVETATSNSTNGINYP
jgi:hypothetical protein